MTNQFVRKLQINLSKTANPIYKTKDNNLKKSIQSHQSPPPRNFFGIAGDLVETKGMREER